METENTFLGPMLGYMMIDLQLLIAKDPGEIKLTLRLNGWKINRIIIVNEVHVWNGSIAFG